MTLIATIAASRPEDDDHDHQLDEGKALLMRRGGGRGSGYAS